MIRKLLERELTTAQKEFIGFEKESTRGLLKALEKAIINNDNGIGLPYWSKKDPVMVKDLTFALVELGYATIKATSKYSRLEFKLERLDHKQLKEWRIATKLKKFSMRLDTKDHPANLVKSNKDIKETGLVREGFAKVAKNEFTYDTALLMQYHTEIRLNLIKSMTKAKAKGKVKDRYFADTANYEAIIDYCLNDYVQGGTYNLEYNISDSRGRSIYNAVKRVGNPISSKDFRALIVMPYTLVHRENKEQMDDIYYFIAELLSSKAKTETTKVAQGKRWYNMRKLPTLDLSLEDDRDDLHELIWLTRIYNQLDELYARKMPFIRWVVPLEIDASMSVAQFAGALTNDERLLQRTNVIGSTLVDPWFINGVRRLSAKSVGTPVFYGSSQSATSLLTKKGISICKTEIKAIRKEFNDGGLAIIRQLKDAIIGNYTKHEPVIKVKIWNDTFDIGVNKFKPAGSDIVVTEAWNGKKYQRSFTHDPVMVPDYDYMKLFWATCLIHNLDSQAMNNIAIKLQDRWMLTIHDAILTAPGTARLCRNEYALQLKEINKARNSILWGYRESIGATTLKADIAFMKLHNAVHQAPEQPFNATAMK